MAFQNPGLRQLQEMQERARKQQEEQRHRMEMAAHYKRLKEEQERLRAQQLRAGAAAGRSPSSPRMSAGAALQAPRRWTSRSPLGQPTPPGRPYTLPDGHPMRAILLLPVLLVIVALVGIAIGWLVEYGINFGETASVVAAGAFWIIGGLWAVWRSIVVWRGE